MHFNLKAVFDRVSEHNARSMVLNHEHCAMHGNPSTSMLKATPVTSYTDPTPV